jgi:hypothetical protein
MIPVEWVLERVADVLFEANVNTFFGTGISPGTIVVTPNSMIGIYDGAILLAGVRGVNLELITASSVTATTFTATFTLTHPGTDPLVGATFPSGLFNQAEMLAYYSQVQNDFLLQVQPVYSSGGSIAITTGDRVYEAPSDAIRVERISIQGEVLYDVSEDDLDTEDAAWMAAVIPPLPTSWFQNKLGNQLIGFSPMPQVNDTAEVWYSQRAPVTPLLSDVMFIPDIFWGYIKAGILARTFAKDGEMRDPMRAVVYQRRYDLGVRLGKKFMMGTDAEVKSPKTSEANAGT